MTYDDLLVLIPSHSLEDFPAELAEKEAASLLNSFAVAWHPALLANVKVLPRWHRADDPPDSAQRRILFLPMNCESWVPAGWADRVSSEGCAVIRGISDREEMIAAALKALGDEVRVDPDLAGDFLSLGFCYLQIELLTRKMRHFSNLDEVHLRREAVAAAEAAVAGDADTAKTRLKTCFEVLVEARERFYPVECYLIDLCLLIPRLADEHLKKTLQTPKPVSVLASANDLKEIAEKSPEVHAALRSALEGDATDLICGDLCELPLPLMPLSSVLWQMREARRVVANTSSSGITVWGRRRYGLFPQLPQILKRSGFAAGLHVVMDDGFYPDHEYSKFRWEGTDGTSIDAWSRIPLAADAATSFLRFPDRMSESMDNDHVAAVAFARWPEVKCPFYDDLRRMHAYGPVLGRFATFGDFFENTESPTKHGNYKPREYLTPFLFQSAARDEADAITRYAERFLRRQRFEAGRWCAGMRPVLMGKSPDAAASEELERAIEELPEIPIAEKVQTVEGQLERFVAESAQGLANLIAGGGNQPGYLVLNPLPFRRMTTVSLDGHAHPPQPTGENCWVQWGEKHKALTVDVAGSGFAWVPAGEAVPAAPPGPPLAEENILRNEFFEVHINSTTGGIGQIKGYGRSPNRLSQQVNYRFPRERTFTVREGEFSEQVTSQYAEMRRQASEITCAGPALGEIVSTGEIIDQSNNQRLAGYKQTVRVWRGRPIVELDIELTLDKKPDGEPWHNYFCSRFAWNDETASLTRSAMMGAFEPGEERIESPHYLEIATPEQRTTILTMGRPFHRKTGPRMVDSILVVARESTRRFRFVIAVDQNYPMQAALDAMTPALVVPTKSGPPRSGTAGWFFHLSARSVQVLELLPPAPSDSSPSGGCILRMIETEGRPVRCKLRCFRTPKSARQLDLLGNPICDLSIDGDAVLADFTAHEIVDVEIRF